MNILLVSATQFEISPLLKCYKAKAITNITFEFVQGDNTFTVLISGVGIYATIYSLTKQIAANQYDLVLNCGVSGTYTDFTSGKVVCVKTEVFADVGRRGNDAFYSIFDMGFADKGVYPFYDGKLYCDNVSEYDINIPTVDGATVNTIASNKKDNLSWKEKYNADIETMEGAAFFTFVKMRGVPFLQFRSISNIVGEIDKTKWQLNLAISDINEYMISFINSL